MVHGQIMPIRFFQNKAPQFDDSVYIDDSAVLVGEISIGKDSSIWPIVAARGDVNYIEIGEQTNIQDGTVLHVSRSSEKFPLGFPLIIGNQVTVGHKCMLHGCIIKNRVLVGMGAIVMDGAVVEDEVIIGAGSLVPPNKTLESGFLYLGNPTKKVRPLKQSEIEFLSASAENYSRLKDEYLKAQ